MNEQKPSAPWYDVQGLLSLHSVFPTIQGEGPFAGHPAVFVRLAGCNLQCPMCDTEYTQNAHLMPPRQIVEAVRRDREIIKARLVVITGGEPLRQNIVPLLTLLFEHDTMLQVQIETNGMFWLPNIDLLPPSFLDRLTIVCSPKTTKINPHLASAAHAFKYVVSACNVDDDGLPLRVLDHPASPRVARPPTTFRGRVYVQPADAKDDRLNRLHMETAVHSCMTHGYTLCLQMHKYANLD